MSSCFTSRRRNTSQTVGRAWSGADGSRVREFLEAHNSYRKLHGAPPLALSNKKNQAEHTPILPSLIYCNTYINIVMYIIIFVCLFYPIIAKEAVDSWYSEVKDYNWNNPGLKSNTGHFTQVVWKETTQLGVGVATVGTRSYVVAQYRPAGNMTMPGKFETESVPKSQMTH
uniref:SCP domain-containing protein n=1 Tax=Cynoglossus semilaevis TaxID=244447 RepID=A0A3P8WJH3_CYNSE